MHFTAQLCTKFLVEPCLESPWMSYWRRWVCLLPNWTSLHQWAPARYSPFAGDLASSGPHLWLSKVEVEEVVRDGTEEKEKRWKIHESWKAKFAFKAKYMLLIKTLLKIRKADQAKQICLLLVPQQPKEGILSRSCDGYYMDCCSCYYQHCS